MTDAAINIGHGQIQGQRDYQQDYYTCLGFDTLGRRDQDQSALIVLADGMGGHVGGAEASSLAVATFVRAFQESNPEDEIAKRLGEALAAANNAIGDTVRDDPSLAGMGCTLVGAHYDSTGMAWVSVGDSPMWILRGDRLDRVNADHSMREVIDDLVSKGELNRHDADNYWQANALRSAVIGEPLDFSSRESVDLWRAAPVKLVRGERLIVASDGIQTLSPEEIVQVVSNPTLSCQQMVDVLLSRIDELQVQGQDNATIMIFEPGNWEARKPNVVPVSRHADEMTMIAPPPITTRPTRRSSPLQAAVTEIAPAADYHSPPDIPIPPPQPDFGIGEPPRPGAWAPQSLRMESNRNDDDRTQILPEAERSEIRRPRGGGVLTGVAVFAFSLILIGVGFLATAWFYPAPFCKLDLPLMSSKCAPSTPSAPGGSVEKTAAAAVVPEPIAKPKTNEASRAAVEQPVSGAPAPEAPGVSPVPAAPNPPVPAPKETPKGGSTPAASPSGAGSVRTQ